MCNKSITMSVLVFSCCLMFACGNVKQKEIVESITENKKLDSTYCEKNMELSNDSLEVSLCYKYNSKGELIRKGHYHDGVAVGLHEFYKNSVLTGKREYIRTGENSFLLNQVYKFDELGDTIIGESNFFILKCIQDTIQLGDSLEFYFRYRAPFKEGSQTLIYFDDINDSEKVVRLIAENNKRKFYLLPDKVGEGDLFGNIIEMIGSGKEIQERKFIFSIPYFIK